MLFHPRGVRLEGQEEYIAVSSKHDSLGKLEPLVPANRSAPSNKGKGALQVGSGDLPSNSGLDERESNESSGECFRDPVPAIDRQADARGLNFDSLPSRFAHLRLDPFEIPSLRFGQMNQAP